MAIAFERYRAADRSRSLGPADLLFLTALRAYEQVPISGPHVRSLPRLPWACVTLAETLSAALGSTPSADELRGLLMRSRGGTSERAVSEVMYRLVEAHLIEPVATGDSAVWRVTRAGRDADTGVSSGDEAAAERAAQCAAASLDAWSKTFLAAVELRESTSAVSRARRQLRPRLM